MGRRNARHLAHLARLSIALVHDRAATSAQLPRVGRYAAAQGTADLPALSLARLREPCALTSAAYSLARNPVVAKQVRGGHR